MSTVKQILRGFWLPLVAASAWTSYVLWSSQISVKTVLTAFGPAFFLASWMTGQFFRVRKQEHVQGGLKSLESRLENLVVQLEVQAKEITGHTTGGDSYCFVSVGVQGDQSSWSVVNTGKYPMYNIAVRIVDLQILRSSQMPGSTLRAETIYQAGDIAPWQARPLASLNLGSGDERDFNVFFTARNGFFSQLVRFRRIDGVWVSATAVQSMQVKTEENPVYTKVHPAYPVNKDGSPQGI